MITADQSPASQIADRIHAGRLLPVLRVPHARDAIAAAERLIAAGLDVIEITATTSEWPSALERLCRDHPTSALGVGTVTTADDARRAADSGASFVVSPWPAAAVRAVADRKALLFLEGGWTPSEIAAATGHGPAKLFPAHVGGPGYLRSLLSVLPEARIIPTGGIQTDQVAGWLAAGAYAVGVGSDLLRRGDVAARVSEARAQ